MIKNTWLLPLLIIVVVGLFGCVPEALLTFHDKDLEIDRYELSRVAMELSEELLQRDIDTVAVTDFTDSWGLVSDFERSITEQIFLSMAGFSGKLWVVGGEYLEHSLDSQEADEVWPVMGVKAVVSGTIQTDSETVTLQIQITEAESKRPIHSIQRECRVLKEREEFAYIAPKEGLRSRGSSSFPHGIPAFLWPPPEASASMKIPSQFLIDSNAPATTLAQVAQRLESAFAQTGYVERSYYSVPGGFALVSRLEQFNPDGSSKTPPERWAAEITPPKVFSLSSYMKALFLPQEGHFRIIIFLVTSAPFAQQPENVVTQEEAQEWLSGGTQMLPPSLGNSTYSDRHYCVALVYEFEQSSRNHTPEFRRLSRLPGFEHLKKSRLWETLEK